MKCNKCIEKCEDCGQPIINQCGCQCHKVAYYHWSGVVPCCPCYKNNNVTFGAGAWNGSGTSQL